MNLQDCSSPDEKRSLSTSISSEETPTDTEQSPDSDESHTNRKKNADAGSIKFGFESLHTYEKRMSSLPPQPSSRADSDFRGFSSLESAESRGLIGGSRSLKARLAERARTLEAERRRLAEEKRMAEEQPDQNAQEEDPADEDRFYKKVSVLNCKMTESMNLFIISKWICIIAFRLASFRASHSSGRAARKRTEPAEE